MTADAPRPPSASHTGHPQPKRNPQKARAAAAHPDRPGEECRAEPGTWQPQVNRRRCEGKGDCVEVCPYGVFALGPIDEAEYQSFPFFTRMKLRAHGKVTAHLPLAEACRACGLCVVACPEAAITLVQVAPQDTPKG